MASTSDTANSLVEASTADSDRNASDRDSFKSKERDKCPCLTDMTKAEIIAFTQSLLKEKETLVKEKEELRMENEEDKRKISQLENQEKKRKQAGTVSMDSYKALYRAFSEISTGLLTRDMGVALYQHVFGDALNKLDVLEKGRMDSKKDSLGGIAGFWKQNKDIVEVFEEETCVPPEDFWRIGCVTNKMRNPGDKFVHEHNDEIIDIFCNRFKDFIVIHGRRIGMQEVTIKYLCDNIKGIDKEWAAQEKEKAPRTVDVSRVCDRKRPMNDAEANEDHAPLHSAMKVKDDGDDGKEYYFVKRIMRPRKRNKSSPKVAKLYVSSKATPKSTPSSVTKTAIANAALGNPRPSSARRTKKRGAAAKTPTSGRRPPTGQSTRSGERSGKASGTEQAQSSERRDSTTGSRSRRNPPGHSPRGEATNESFVKRLEFE